MSDMSTELATIATDIHVAPETAIDPDGFIYRVDDGEIVGHRDASEAFAIDSTERADWALELRSKVEGDLVAIRARRAALIQQFDALEQTQTRLLDWWRWRFAAELEAYARTSLEGRKERTARFTWGSVAFRKTKGTNQITDMEKAADWMEEYDADRVKVKTERTVSVKDVLEVREYVARLFGHDSDEAHPTWLQSSGEGEKVTIETGIQLEAPTRKALK